MSRAVVRPAAGIQLFPFLAVLVCTTGALVMLLFVFARRGQVDAPIAAAVQQAPDGDETMDAEAIQWRIAQLKDSRTKTQSQLADARLELSHLEDHMRRLRRDAERVEREVQEMLRVQNGTGQEQAVAEGELARLKRQINESQKSLIAARKAAAGAAPVFSIVPYEGTSITRRRPIYLECTGEAVILQPEGIAFVPADFQGPLGPGNPLAAAMRAAREYLVAQQSDTIDKTEPYPLLVVRPDGIVSYDAARTALASWGAEFGYELVGADTRLKFPPADPQLAQHVRDVVADARLRQQELILAAPQPYKKAAKPTFHVKNGGGGIERDDDPHHGGSGSGRAYPYARRGSGGRGQGGRGSGKSGMASGLGTGDANAATGYAGSGYSPDRPDGGTSGGGGGGLDANGENASLAAAGPNASGLSSNPYSNVLTQAGGGSSSYGLGTGPGGATGGAYGNGAGSAGAGDNNFGAGANALGAAGSGPGQSGTGAGSGGPNLGQPGSGSGPGSPGSALGTAGAGDGTAGTASGNGTMGNGAGTPGTGSGTPGSRAGAGGKGTGAAGNSDATGTGAQAASGKASGGGNSAGGVGAGANSPGAGASGLGMGSPPKLSVETANNSSASQDRNGSPVGSSTANKSGGQTPHWYDDTQDDGKGSANGGASSTASARSKGQRSQSTPSGSASGNTAGNSSAGGKAQNNSRLRSLADSRGTDWGLPDASESAVPVTRPVIVECYGDRLVILTDEKASAGKQIGMGAQTEDAVDDLVSSVWQHMKSWGLAGRGLYWRPTLMMRVAPDGRRRFEELQQLLANSGLEVRESSKTATAASVPQAKPLRR